MAVGRPPDRFFADPTLAALYDPFVLQASRNDFDFYLPIIMAADAVLDVGCGTGALLIEARDKGHKGRLCGVDPAPGMLDLARKRGDVDWRLGELGSIEVGEDFDLAVMTGHAFQVFLEDDEIRAILSAVRRALKPGGLFAFETRNPLDRAWERWGPEIVFEVTGADDTPVRMTRKVVAPFDGRTVSFTHTFSSPAWLQDEVSGSTLRFLDRNALNGFLDAAGFEIDAQYGDWDRSPFDDESPEIITLARA